jgi:hypothetical protein
VEQRGSNLAQRFPRKPRGKNKIAKRFRPVWPRGGAISTALEVHEVEVIRQVGDAALKQVAENIKQEDETLLDDIVEWKYTLPNIPLAGCESEVWLSLDSGITFPVWITWLDARSTSSSVMFRTRLPTGRSWTSASDVTCIIPKATLPVCIDVHHREEWSADVLNSAREHQRL